MAQRLINKLARILSLKKKKEKKSLKCWTFSISKLWKLCKGSYSSKRLSFNSRINGSNKKCLIDRRSLICSCIWPSDYPVPEAYMFLPLLDLRFIQFTQVFFGVMKRSNVKLADGLIGELPLYSRWITIPIFLLLDWRAMIYFNWPSLNNK